MEIKRVDGRFNHELRNLKLTGPYYGHVLGSCFIEMGNTKVICSVTMEKKVPKWMPDNQSGWINAEYALLPNSTKERVNRERDKVGGRTLEIQRLISRSLRAAVHLECFKGISFTVDCDVILADGGTRTASITGAFVALVQAVHQAKSKGIITFSNSKKPFKDFLSAISMGVNQQGQLLLDLNYVEDAACDVDLNLVMLGKQKIVEVQGTAEKSAFTPEQLQGMMSLGQEAMVKIQEAQKQALGDLPWQDYVIQ